MTMADFEVSVWILTRLRPPGISCFIFLSFGFTIYKLGSECHRIA